MGSDDEPIYDHVASDDDYYNIPETPGDDLKTNSLSRGLKNSIPSPIHSSPAKSQTSSINKHSSEYFALKQQLESSEQRVQALIDSNEDMRSEISRLSTMVNKLVNENHSLREIPVENEYATPNLTKPVPPVRNITTTVTSFLAEKEPTSLPINATFSPRRFEEETKSLPVVNNYYNPTSNSCLPSQEEVVRRTEAITRCIQELLVSAKDEKFDAFIPCSERIVRAVTDMVSLFPETEDGDDDAPWGRSPLGLALADLMAAAHHFETECRILIARSQKEPLHQGFVTQQVIQCAFDIAKSTKHLVAMFQ